MTTPTPQLLTIARETGYKGIEARAERLLEQSDEVNATAAIVKPNEVLTLNGVRLSLGPDGAMLRELLEADLTARLQICRSIGAPYLLAVPPRAPGVSSRRAISGTRDALELARDRGAVLGVKIAFEFLGFADCPINSPAIAAETVDAIDAIDLVLDSCHWHASGSQPLDGFPIDRLALVHLNDAPAKPPREIEDADRVLPGEGVIRLSKLIGHLSRGGYHAPWSLETFNPLYWAKDPASVARRGLAALDRITS